MVSRPSLPELTLTEIEAVLFARVRSGVVELTWAVFRIVAGRASRVAGFASPYSRSLPPPPLNVSDPPPPQMTSAPLVLPMSLSESLPEVPTKSHEKRAFTRSAIVRELPVAGLAGMSPSAHST
jgi:hypothetical protein